MAPFDAAASRSAAAAFAVGLACGAAAAAWLLRRQAARAAAGESEIDVSAIPEACPGLESEAAGKGAACAGCPNQAACASGATKAAVTQVPTGVKERLGNVKHKLVVMSGKGGVGKSTMAAQLAWSLRDKGYYVGLLDVDICGPSIPRMMGVMDQEVHWLGEGWTPVYAAPNLAVMSVGFLLPHEDDPLIWRGPKKNGLIKQFLSDVMWEELDFLIIDTPPGTSDEHLSVVTYLKDADVDGAVIVTTPQEVSLSDVRKEINFCKKSGLSVVGVVDNMTNSVFEHCRGLTQSTCDKMSVPYLGRISLKKELLVAAESGCSLMGLKRRDPSLDVSGSAQEVDCIVDKVLTNIGVDPGQRGTAADNEQG
eukprot:Selendium_serpulae@DN2592_c0_g1_i3.p1